MLENYIKHLKVNSKSPKTMHNYCFWTERFLESAKKPVEKITINDINNFLVDYSNPFTLNCIKASLRSFFLYKDRDDLVKKIKASRTPKKRTKLPTPDEIIKKIEGVENERNKTILYTLYGTGMRVGELVNFKKEWLQDDGSIIIREGKGAKDRIIVHIPKIVLKRLLKIKNSKKHKGTHFFALKNGKPLSIRAIQRVVKNNTGYTPHDFRRMYITHQLEAGALSIEVQRAVGHESLSTTERYFMSSKKFSIKELSKHPLDKLK